MQLIDVGLTVDTDGLEQRLDEIENKITAMGEDAVRELVDNALADRDLPDADGVREIFRHMAHGEGEEFVRDTISNEGYVTDDDVDQKLRDLDLPDENRISTMIEDALSESDFIDRSDVLDILRDEGLDSNDVADAEEVETLKRDVADLARRFEVYANRVDEWRGGKVDLPSVEHLAERIGTLETLLAERGQKQDAVNTHLIDAGEAMVARIAALEGSNETAVTFFGLIQKAFDLLMQGRRGS